MVLRLFVVLPYFLLPAKAKRYYIQINKEGIVLKRMIRRLQLKWSDVEFISCRNNLLKLKSLGKRKIYNCYLKENEPNLKQAVNVIEEAQVENKFVWELGNL